jgi:hypothetical protein
VNRDPRPFNLIDWIMSATSPQMVAGRVRSASFHAQDADQLRRLKNAGRRALSDIRDSRIRIGGRR